MALTINDVSAHFIRIVNEFCISYFNYDSFKHKEKITRKNLTFVLPAGCIDCHFETSLNRQKLHSYIKNESSKVNIPIADITSDSQNLAVIYLSRPFFFKNILANYESNAHSSLMHKEPEPGCQRVIVCVAELTTLMTDTGYNLNHLNHTTLSCLRSVLMALHIAKLLHATTENCCVELCPQNLTTGCRNLFLDIIDKNDTNDGITKNRHSPMEYSRGWDVESTKEESVEGDRIEHEFTERLKQFKDATQTRENGDGTGIHGLYVNVGRCLSKDDIFRNILRDTPYIKVHESGSLCDVFKHACAIEHHFRLSDLKADAAMLCLWVVPHTHCHSLARAVALWRLLSRRFNVAQHIIQHGGVDIELMDADEADEASRTSTYLSGELVCERYRQLQSVGVMKYGEENSEQYMENARCLSRASVTFDILSTSFPRKLKLKVEAGISNKKSGVFVIYNYARLSSLFRHYQQAVCEGKYPPLPSVESLDFSCLNSDNEWDLLFNYVWVYPTLVKDCVGGARTGETLSHIYTHKICAFVCSLSQTLSSYYSHTHILGESKPHLYPAMFARLWLLKAVHSVMHSCLETLDITAPQAL